jgi:hypothetical protein
MIRFRSNGENINRRETQHLTGLKRGQHGEISGLKRNIPCDVTTHATFVDDIACIPSKLSPVVEAELSKKLRIIWRSEWLNTFSDRAVPTDIIIKRCSRPDFFACVSFQTSFITANSFIHTIRFKT